MTTKQNGRVCVSKLKGFDGCETVPMQGVESCPACYAEYKRRSNAREEIGRQDHAELVALLAPMSALPWQDRPKVRVTFGGLFGASAREGKIYGGESYYVLLKQRNSTRGPIVAYMGINATDTHKVEIMGKDRQYVTAWEARNIYTGVYSLEAKEVADSLERLSA